MKIESQAAIEVHQVANGYLVKLPYSLTRGEYQPVEASVVFQTFAEMVSWLSEHFTHRNSGIADDAL